MRIIGIKEGRNQKNDMRKRNTGQRTENGGRKSGYNRFLGGARNDGKKGF